MSKSESWFKDNVSENREELLKVAEMGNKMLHQVLSMTLQDDYVVIAIYGQIFQAACEEVAKREKDYDNFDLNFASIMHIGYNTTDNEDDEKVGNFMPYMTHIDNPKLDSVLDEEETDTLALAAMWNALNVKTQSEIVKDVAVEAVKRIGQYINLKVESHEYIVPMFGVIHAQLIRFLKQTRQELGLSDYEINVCGLFNAGCMINDDTEEEIYFTPSIALKLLFKNDSIASADGDDE